VRTGRIKPYNLDFTKTPGRRLGLENIFEEASLNPGNIPSMILIQRIFFNSESFVKGGSDSFLGPI